MKNDDFCYMRRGKQLSRLTSDELTLLAAVDKRSTGNNRALLVLHGFSSSPAVYRYLIPALKNYNAIVCPVLPGHGDSVAAFANVTAEDWISTTNQLCESLIKEYKKVDVLGLSLGGLLACKLSERYALNHLYLLAPALRLQMNAGAMLKLAYVLQCLGFRQLRNAAGNLMTNENAEIGYRKLPVAIIIEMLQLVQNYQWIPPKCPVDLFLGLHDQVVSSPEVEQLFASLPKATIHWLLNSAHVLPLDNDVNQIINCINKNK